MLAIAYPRNVGCSLSVFHFIDVLQFLSLMLRSLSGSITFSLFGYVYCHMFQLRPTLSRAVEASCDIGNEYHLLREILDKEFCVLRQRLDDTNFGDFILKIWNTLIVIFSEIVEINSVVSNYAYCNITVEIL